jgi:UDP-glucuronate 4-epimerase
MQRVLVTGGAGFIGSHLCQRLLLDGYEVVCLDNFDPFYDPAIKRRNLEEIRAIAGDKGFEQIEGDIRDKGLLENLFRRSSFDMVIHLAARAGVRPSIQQPLLYEEINVTGTLNLLEACREFGVMDLIFGSSSSVYGRNSKVPFAEEDRLDSMISPYAVTKRVGELYCYAYHHLYGLNISCLRFFTVYGPRQRPEMAIHKFARLIQEGEKVPLYGDGTSRRDYTYIDDIIEGIMGAIRNFRGYEIFNLGESRTVPLRELISLLEGALGKKAIVEEQPEQPGDVPITYADISQARRLLGYDPQVEIEEGVERFVRWFRDRG